MKLLPKFNILASSDNSIELEKKDVSKRPDILPVLRIASLGHAILVFVNGDFIGKHLSKCEYYIAHKLLHIAYIPTVKIFPAKELGFFDF